MKTEAQIESLLRKAPTPKPAPQLTTSLKSAIKLPGHANGADLELSVPLWRRWFPALAYAVLILGCVMVLAVQNNQQRELIRQNEQLRAEIAMAEEAAEERQQLLAKAQSAAREIEQWQRDAAEADRLAVRLAELQAQIAALTAQAKELEAQLAVVPENQQVIAPYDFFDAATSPLNEARERAASISCINNLKQIGLASRIWANDNDGWFPPTLNSMSNELHAVRTLCCPLDKANLELARSLVETFRDSGGQGYQINPTAAWAKWPLNGGSYEMLTANVQQEAVPIDQMLARCRIHGHYVQADGAAFMAKNEEAP
jgi:multidrug efflux pump subunit AcrA (membrane-fusion protein)